MMAGCSVNGARWALGSDSEGRDMWPEGMVVKAVEILIKDGGGKDSVFRVEPGSEAKCSRKRWKILKRLLTTEPLQGERWKGLGGRGEVRVRVEGTEA